jgi:translocation and assembly module TamB
MAARGARHRRCRPLQFPLSIKRLLRRCLAGFALVLLLGALLLWLSRMRIATAIVDRKLTAAGVPASYRITRVGPFLERMEDVRIGDPARPDLVARRIDVALGYSLTGPKVTGVTVDGVRLAARLDKDGLHLGALDRLLPKSSGGAVKLPDLAVSLRDSVLTLESPNGIVRAQLAGAGNPARRFDGDAIADAAALRLASCTLTNTFARMKVRVVSGRPTLIGPLAIGGTSCPGLKLGSGTAQITAGSNISFDHIDLTANLNGFGGMAGPARFARLRGPVIASGALGALHVQTEMAADHLALPDASRHTSTAVQLPASIPITPTVTRASKALATLLADSQAQVSAEAAITGTQVDVRIRQASLTGSNGARLNATEQGGMRWSPAGWRADGNVAFAGGDLPTGTLQIRQAAVGASLTVSGHLAPYRAGAAQLALPTLTARWDGKVARFAARALVDGPIGDGSVTGLDIPLAGYATSTGAVVVGQGCQPLAFRTLRQAGFVVAPTRLTLCGKPIFTRTAAGAIRLDATTGPVHLAARSAAGAPLSLDAAKLRLTTEGVAAEAVAVALGDTHLNVARIEGRFGTSAATGRYADASGAIANVPLLLSNAAGSWRFAAGALSLTGALRVSDADPSPRFYPLVTDDLRLSFANNVIDAAATLRAPAGNAEVAKVTLTHRLADSIGHAALAVPGITFVPKKLQPEALTPLTLGVIANVAGTLTGEGRIDWSAAGVTSRGSFATDRLDLAAAFGPVTGIKGRIVFTDLLGLVTAPHQEATIAEVNPGVAVANGTAHYQLLGGNRVKVEDATWPFAGGTLRLDPTTLDFGAEAERRLTFRVEGLDAAAFVQQLDFPNLAATGRFDGLLPMIFDKQGGRIENGDLTARPGGGTIAYVGELSRAKLGTMGKLAFDALKAIRYSNLAIRFDGKLDGEMISQVQFTGVREATPDQSLVTRLIRNLPFRFNIRIRAPFRGLVGSARSYMDPRLLLNQPIAPPPPVQPSASDPVR